MIFTIGAISVVLGWILQDQGDYLDLIGEVLERAGLAAMLLSLLIVAWKVLP